MRIPEERIHPDFRPLPLWAWNGEMTEHRIAETLQQFSDRGFGGAFIHPRPGLVTEYLSETWFDLWRFAQSTAHALGLQVHLYDENSYPSGFAGGHVLERRPEFSLRKLVCILASEPTSRDRLQEFSLGANRLAIELQPTDPNGWYGGKTYVDLLQPGATEEFLRLTHERYSLEVDCQGLLAFTDEPQVMDYSKGALPWSEMVQHRFREMHGWDLTPQLPHLFANIDPESPTLRYRYQETLLHLFEEHFLMPMAERCKSLGMAFTGHFHEHEWPCPRYHANSMLAQSWMHIPGIDLLGFQFDPANRQTSGRWLLTILEAVSVAAQQGKCKILCEAYGGGGYQVGLGELKRMGDYLLANGINLLVPHLSYQTMVGARKYDWPQTLSDHAPFWDDCEPLQRHQAKVAASLAEGTSMADVLVLQPTASGWLHWTPDSEAAGRTTELPPKTQTLRDQHSAFLLGLSDLYIDFHLGDEWLMERMAKPVEGGLAIGPMVYREIVIPATIESIRAPTLDLLAAASAAGGTIWVYGNGPTFLDGEPSPVPRERLNRFIQTATAPQQIGKNSRILEAAPGLSIARRSTPQGICWFLANPWDTPYRSTVTLPAPRSAPRSVPRSAPSPFELQLNPGEHRLWHQGDSHFGSSLTQPIPLEPVPLEPITLELVDVQRLGPNVLPIDQCVLNLPMTSYGQTITLEQNRRLWQAHGLNGDPWEWGVQFRQEIVNLKVPNQIGFQAKYRFNSDQPRSIHVALEQPWRYEVTLNGALLAFQEESFFDEEMRLSHPALAQTGENTISLTAARLDPRHELAPVWILGDFAVVNQTLQEPVELTFGDWGSQGLPYYPWTVSFLFRLRCETPGNLILRMEDRGVSSGEALLNGAVVAKYWDGAHQISLGSCPAGAHRLELRLRGTLRNLLGPFGVEGLPGPWLWVASAEVPKKNSAQVPTGLSGIQCDL